MKEIILLLVISSANLVFGVPPVASGNINYNQSRMKYFLMFVFLPKICILDMFLQLYRQLQIAVFVMDLEPLLSHVA